MAPTNVFLGIDIGGSGIKGALVDVEEGVLVTDRHRIPTPKPSKRGAVAEVVLELTRHFSYRGPVGCTFPAVVLNGVTLTAANVDDDWIGTDAATLFATATDLPVFVLNDADAAGVAEVAFGAGRGVDGTVMVLTFGTGIGTAVFTDGELVANTELGHLELNGRVVEPWASGKARSDENLSWKRWATRVDRYLRHLEMLFQPALFIIGGGVSGRSDRFFHLLTTRAPVVAAKLRNQAGIVGAAVMAARWLNHSVESAEAESHGAPRSGHE